ncbi:MAG TPA: ERF family protein [Aestuariivirga sp.]|nr:ERF family protein [Aestuariivirga sp.]
MTAQETITAGVAVSAQSGIISAVAKAMGEMKRIAKDSRNIEQKYDFASVDDFLAMTGPICAANGIITILDEEAVEDFERQGKYGVTHWLRIRFAISTMHTSGETLPVVRRTVEVIRTGAQSFGSAQSYVLKQYQRALYQIPTGDKDDADFAEKGDGPATKAQPKQDHTPRDNGPTAAQIACDSLTNADTLEALGAIWQGLPVSIKGEATVFKAKDDRKAALQPKQNADLADEIPY